MMRVGVRFCNATMSSPTRVANTEMARLRLSIEHFRELSNFSNRAREVRFVIVI